MILEQDDCLDLAIHCPAVVNQRVAAHLTEPRVQGGLAPIGVEPLDRFAKGLLHDISGCLVVAVQAGQSESIEPREEAVEQLAKRVLIATQNSPGKGPVDVHRCAHACSACLS